MKNFKLNRKITIMVSIMCLGYITVPYQAQAMSSLSQAISVSTGGLIDPSPNTTEAILTGGASVMTDQAMNFAKTVSKYLLKGTISVFDATGKLIASSAPYEIIKHPEDLPTTPLSSLHTIFPGIKDPINITDVITAFQSEPFNPQRLLAAVEVTRGSGTTFTSTEKALANAVTTQVNNAISTYQKSYSAADLAAAVNLVESLKPYHIPTTGGNAYKVAYQQLVTVIANRANDLFTAYKALTTPGRFDLSGLVSFVNTLQPYNNDLQISGVGIYDYAVDQLTQAVVDHLTVHNNVDTVTAHANDINANNSFSDTVAVDGPNADGSTSVYVSAPVNNSANNMPGGLIYELRMNAKGHWRIFQQPITPLATISVPEPNNNFGRVFAVKGNLMAVGVLPPNGNAKIYVFTRTTSNAPWIQSNKILVSTVANIDPTINPLVHSMNLALSQNMLVVTLPESRECLIVDPATGTFEKEIPPVAQATNNVEPVDASGNYIVIGYPAPPGGKSTDSYVRVIMNTGNTWEIKDIHSTSAGFGHSVAVYQPPINALAKTGTVTVVIGSPRENSNAGAVYTKTATLNMDTNGDPAANTTVWSALQPVNLFMPSTAFHAGAKVAFKAGTLMVRARTLSTPVAVTSIVASVLSGIPVDASSYKSMTMVYRLDTATNQSAWAYSVQDPVVDMGDQLATDGTTDVIGTPLAIPTNIMGPVVNENDSQVEIVSPKS